MRRLLGWSLAGVIAGVLLGLVDGAAIVVGARSMFFSGGEAWRAALWCVALGAGSGGIGLTALGALVEPCLALSPRLGRWGRPPLAALIVGALLAGPAFLLLWRLTAGPQASQLPARPILVGALALVAAVGAGYLATAVPVWATRSRGRRLLVAGSGALVAGALTVADFEILVRLYPIFHGALTALAFAVLGVSLRVAIGVPRSVLWAVAGSILLVAGIATGAHSLRAARATQNARFVIGERTAAAADILALAHRWAPPPPERALDADPVELEATLPATAGPTLSRPGADVFLITVDAMRHDRLALAGSPRPPAKELDALAARSVVFTRAYTAIPYTSYALTSMLTGKYTRSLTLVPGAPPVLETWPEIMHRFRYRSAAFFTRAVFFIDRVHFEPYIRSSFGFSYRKVDYRVPAEERAEQLLDYLAEERDDDRPIFAWTHFFDPHEPYDPSCTAFGERPEDRYDCEISRVSRSVGKILDYLDREHPDAIVIVTSDHGEEFGDHGGKFHGTTLYDEQVRVPLIIRVPGLPHRVVDEPVSLVDLLGTVLSILDIPVPARVRSRDLSGLLTGRRDSLDAFAELGDRGMVTTRSHKLICDHVKKLCRLYDMEDDPGERRSEADAQPEVLGRMKARLERWRASHARVELRPVVDGGDMTAWPPAVRKALAGDDDAVPGLVTTLADDERPAVRRKAAELLRHLWAERPLTELPSTADEDDPEVAAWLALIRADREPAACGELGKLAAKLTPLSDPWRAAVLECFDPDDPGSVDDAVEVVLHEPAPLAERLEAISLVGRSGRREVVPAIAPLIDDYQLTLAAAGALGQLKDRRPVKALIARLKRERFLERRAALVESLRAIGDRRAGPAIAAELGRDTPTPGAVRALVALGKGRSDEARLEIGGGRTAVIFGAPADRPLAPGLEQVTLAVAATAAGADGGTLVVTCAGREAGRIPLPSGSQEPAAPLEGCRGTGASPLEVRLRVEPPELGAKIDALALIGL